jgi:hypothetical protein
MFRHRSAIFREYANTQVRQSNIQLQAWIALTAQSVYGLDFGLDGPTFESR